MAQFITPIVKEPPPPPDPTDCPTCFSGFQPPIEEFEVVLADR